MKYISIALRALLTLVFLGAGGAKLAGVEMMVETYNTIGLSQWFRYLTGIIEVGGVVLLWLFNTINRRPEALTTARSSASTGRSSPKRYK